MNEIRIAVDAGHGSNTLGKRTPKLPRDIDFNKDGIIDVKEGESIREHIANVGACVFLEKELIRNGYTVLRSGWDDENAYNDADVDIKTRQSLIRKNNCMYSVSVHFNAFGLGDEFNSGEGIATYIHSDKSIIGDSYKLASYVQNQLVKGSVQKNRSIQTGKFGMCNTVGLGTKASILVELAFMTNLREATELMGNSKFWEECAVEICKGICEMDGKNYIETVIDKPKAKLYLVQVGAYSFLDNAIVQLTKIKAAGYKDSFIHKVITEKITRYHVQVGSFSNKENAKKIVQTLEKEGIEAIIKEKVVK